MGGGERWEDGRDGRRGEVGGGERWEEVSSVGIPSPTSARLHLKLGSESSNKILVSNRSPGEWWKKIVVVGSGQLLLSSTLASSLLPLKYTGSGKRTDVLD